MVQKLDEEQKRLVNELAILCLSLKEAQDNITIYAKKCYEIVEIKQQLGLTESSTEEE